MSRQGTVDPDFFQAIFDDPIIRSLSLFFSLLVSTIACILLFGIMWYEKIMENGLQSWKNHIFIVLLKITLFSSGVIINIRNLRVIGRLPQFACAISNIGVNAYVSQVRKNIQFKYDIGKLIFFLFFVILNIT